MTSNPNAQSHYAQPKRTSFSGHAGSNASIFLEKTKAGIRGSTPDSEALASSDDEPDQYHRLHAGGAFAPKPARRASWLNEVQQAPQRKASMGTSGSFSPLSPHSSTPSVDQSSWNVNSTPSGTASAGRNHVTNSSFPWGNAIWNNDPQKGLPLRLSEVLPSPTSLGSPGSTIAPNDDRTISPPLRRDSATESSIPFAIPLQPTLKSYRSQSYSVGQLDPETTNILPSKHAGYLVGRGRGGATYAGLQHRSSRQKMMNEAAHDSSLLGQLREVDDDEESSNGSDAGVRVTTNQAQARTIEKLAMENAKLRAEAGQKEWSQGKQRQVPPQNPSQLAHGGMLGRHHRLQETAPEDTQYALNDVDEPDLYSQYESGSGSGRRSSEYEKLPATQYSIAGNLESRTFESMKRGHWQSSLGFGGPVEPPQSRRHSFAEVPTRPTSIGSVGDKHDDFGSTSSGPSYDMRQESHPSEGMARPPQGGSSEYASFRSNQTSLEQALELEHLHDRQFAAFYFSRRDPSVDAHGSALSPTGAPPAFPVHHPFTRPQHAPHPHPRPNQLLYIVTFKACRAEVFYVQEGTGLQVQRGDLVIVEADRGTDLGTVAHDNISWQKAKDLRDSYVDEHYKWLMMFSRHNQNGSGAGPGPSGQNVSLPSNKSSAIGSMAGQPGTHDATNGEMKPKMIKRLAQPHEISTLREKEGNEAKAKRVCQQKVAEHRLNMEVLDAEFQMDWKKLTFYYFADAYINFNPLVTDLFKIYKTRIWMSAINPASFVTPIAGLPLPSSLDQGAFNPSFDRHTDRASQGGNMTYSASPGHQGTPVAFERPWDLRREPGLASSVGNPQPYVPAYPAHDLESRPFGQFPVEYGHGGPQYLDFQPRLQSPSFAPTDLHQAPYDMPLDRNHDGERKTKSRGHDWNQGFQGLSLGS